MNSIDAWKWYLNDFYTWKPYNSLNYSDVYISYDGLGLIDKCLGTGIRI